MTLSISFYDGVKYHGPDFNQRDKDFYGNGVLYPATSQFPLTYPSTPNMTFTVGQGVAWVDGYRIANDSNGVTLTVPASDPTNPRIDIVQLGHDDVNSTYSLVVKKGVAQASPVEPGADANYIKLYAISVAANATSITSANVTDRRTVLTLNVDGSQINQGGAVANTDPAYLAVKNSTYVVAGTGITTTAGTDQQTVTLKPATASALGGIIPGTGFSVDANGNLTYAQNLRTTDSPTFVGGTFSNRVVNSYSGVSLYSSSGGAFASYAVNTPSGIVGFGANSSSADYTFRLGPVSNSLSGAWTTPNGTNFKVYIAGALTTYDNTVDDGTGKSTWAGLATLNGGATLPPPAGNNQSSNSFTFKSTSSTGTTNTVTVTLDPNGYLLWQNGGSSKFLIGANGTVQTEYNNLDDGISGASAWAGLMTWNGGATLPSGKTLTLNGTVAGSPTWSSTQTFNTISTTQIRSNGSSSFNIVPISGGAVGFTNNAQSAYGLRVTDAASPAAYTLHNTLDDGSGNETIMGSINMGNDRTTSAVKIGTFGHTIGRDVSDGSLHIGGGQANVVMDSPLAVTGLTGATAASRYVGGTTSGAPTTGTFAVGDYVIDQTGAQWICTVAGTPGTWKKSANHFQARVDMQRGTNSTGNTTNTTIVTPMPFTYHASEWNNGTFYAEISFLVANSSATSYVGLWDNTAGAAVAGSEVSTTSTSQVTIRSGGFSLTDGHSYGIYYRTSNASYSVTLNAFDLIALF